MWDEWNTALDKEVNHEERALSLLSFSVSLSLYHTLLGSLTPSSSFPIPTALSRLKRFKPSTILLVNLQPHGGKPPHTHNNLHRQLDISAQLATTANCCVIFIFLLVLVSLTTFSSLSLSLALALDIDLALALALALSLSPLEGLRRFTGLGRPLEGLR